MNPWIHITAAKLHALTYTWPPHRRWEWGNHPEHGVTLKSPRGTLWKFHMKRGPQMRRID